MLPLTAGVAAQLLRSWGKQYEMKPATAMDEFDDFIFNNVGMKLADEIIEKLDFEVIPFYFRIIYDKESGVQPKDDLINYRWNE